MSKPANRMPLIDALKAIAALLVLLNHFSSYGPSPKQHATRSRRSRAGSSNIAAWPYRFSWSLPGFSLPEACQRKVRRCRFPRCH
jgi:hypothetical protein